jgi:Spy/CpxP family protein refolding chaperone
MKLRSLLCLALCAWSFQAGPSTQAAETPAIKPAPSTNLRLLTNRADRVAALANELKLTPQQQDKMRPILQDEGQKMIAIYRDTTLSRETRMSKIQELRDANRIKIKAILTPEQMEQWDKLRQGRQSTNPPRTRPAAK